MASVTRKSQPLTKQLARVFTKSEVLGKQVGYPRASDYSYRYSYTYDSRRRLRFSDETQTKVQQHFDVNFKSGADLDKFLTAVKKQYGLKDEDLSVTLKISAEGTFYRATTQAETDALAALDAARKAETKKRNAAAAKARKARKEQEADRLNTDNAMSLAAALKVIKREGLTIVTLDTAKPPILAKGAK